MRLRTKYILRTQSGFTIVEFMIATAVFGVILMITTGAILLMSQKYQHSLYSSSTQAAASNLVDTIAQSIKFSSGQVVAEGPNNTGTRSICIGNRQFLFILRKQLDGDRMESSTNNAVMTRQRDTGGCLMASLNGPTTPSGSPNELLGKNMRLSNLTIRETSPSLWTVSASVVYGDDDLLCSPVVVGSCESAARMDDEHLLDTRVDETTKINLKPLQCKPLEGMQFCKVSELSTTVYKRL